MKYVAKPIIALFFTLILLVCTVEGVVSAQEDTRPANLWHGDNFVVDVAAGKNGYTFLSVYKSKKNAYEMSNHMVTVDGQNHDITQTLILVDASEIGTWTPNGIYSFGNSNYETTYCCDAETGYVDGVYYKRLNLEDGDYYSVEDAAHIRAIVTNSYPYFSLEQMKKTSNVRALPTPKVSREPRLLQPCRPPYGPMPIPIAANTITAAPSMSPPIVNGAVFFMTLPTRWTYGGRQASGYSQQTTRLRIESMR